MRCGPRQLKRSLAARGRPACRVCRACQLNKTRPRPPLRASLWACRTGASIGWRLGGMCASRTNAPLPPVFRYRLLHCNVRELSGPRSAPAHAALPSACARPAPASARPALQVGGLRDTVTPFDPHSDSGTGWTFDWADAGAFRGALGNALYTYRDYRDAFEGIQRRGMAQVRPLGARPKRSRPPPGSMLWLLALLWARGACKPGALPPCGARGGCVGQGLAWHGASAEVATFLAPTLGLRVFCARGRTSPGTTRRRCTKRCWSRPSTSGEGRRAVALEDLGLERLACAAWDCSGWAACDATRAEKRRRRQCRIGQCTAAERCGQRRAQLGGAVLLEGACPCFGSAGRLRAPPYRDDFVCFCSAQRMTALCALTPQPMLLVLA